MFTQAVSNLVPVLLEVTGPCDGITVSHKSNLAGRKITHYNKRIPLLFIKIFVMPCFILLIFACWFLQLQDDDDDAALLYPKCLGIYGNWLAETRSDNPKVIMEEYLSKVQKRTLFSKYDVLNIM